MREVYRWSFALCWSERRAGHPAPNAYAEWQHFGDEARARRQHAAALSGFWVRPGQAAPSVSSLVETRWALGVNDRLIGRPVERTIDVGDDVKALPLPLGLDGGAP